MQVLGTTGNVVFHDHGGGIVVPKVKTRPDDSKSIYKTLTPEFLKLMKKTNSRLSDSQVAELKKTHHVPFKTGLDFNADRLLTEYERDHIFVSLLLNALKVKRPSKIVVDMPRFTAMYNMTLDNFTDRGFATVDMMIPADCLYVMTAEMEKRVRFFLSLEWVEPVLGAFYRTEPMLHELKTVNVPPPFNNRVSPVPKMGLFMVDGKIYNATKITPDISVDKVTDLSGFFTSGENYAFVSLNGDTVKVARLRHVYG